jgi:ABC-type sugar transport system substrate-binding protein
MGATFMGKAPSLRKGPATAAAVAAALLFSAACGSGSSNGGSASGTPSGSANSSPSAGGATQSASSAGVSSANKYANYGTALQAMAGETVKTDSYKKSGKLNIVNIWQGHNDGWGQTYEVSMRAEAQKYADRATVKYSSFDFDVNKEISILQNAVNTHPDAIIIDAGDVGALVGPVAAAQRAGIPVIPCIDGVLGNAFTSWVGENLHDMAFKSATDLANQMGGKGEVAVFLGVAGNVATVLWSQAANEAFAKFPGIKVVATYYSDWNIAKAKQQAANLIAAHPNVTGIFTGGSEMAVGSIEAYAAANKTSSIPAFGVVNVLNGFLRLAKQYNVKFSGFPLAPAMSSICLDQAINVLDGKPVQKFRDASVELPGQGAGYNQDQASKWYVPELSDTFVPPATAPVAFYKAAGMGR